MQRRHPGGDERPKRIASDVRAPDLQMIEQVNDVSHHFLAVRFWIVGLAALPVTAQIYSNDAMVICQVPEHAVGEEMPIERAGGAVHQHDRRALTLLGAGDATA